MSAPDPSIARSAQAHTNPAAQLRALIAQHRCIAMPGAFNALCARAIAQAGFHAAYISGAATSVCAGVPDVGLVPAEHFCCLIREAHQASGLPIIADADTGFGEAEMVRRTVIDYSRAGAAGLHIEDQQFPKRCGHLDGKALISSDHMIEKVQWAAKAARELAIASSTPSAATTPAIILCARTDARGVEGLPAALDRAEAYVRAGAEMIFPEGLTTATEFQSFARDLRARVPSVLLLANMTEFGKTPITPVSDFASWGYNVVIYPVSLLRVAMGAVTRALADIQQHGSVQPVLSQMQTRQQLYDLINYTPGVPWEMPGR